MHKGGVHLQVLTEVPAEVGCAALGGVYVTQSMNLGLEKPEFASVRTQ